MPIGQVHFVTVFVRDQDRALDFYVNALGFEKTADRPVGPGKRWVTVAPPGGGAEIVLAKADGGWEEDQIGRFSRIVLSTGDAQATYQELSARGVRFSEPPALQPWGGIQAQFADHDGNGYVLVQPPA